MWATDTGECLQVLEGHIDEIFSCAFNYEVGVASPPLAMQIDRVAHTDFAAQVVKSA